MASRRSCSYFGCKNFSDKKHKNTMYAFPSPNLPGSPQEKRVKEWMRRTCNPKILELPPHIVFQRKKSVCADHFDPHQFVNDPRRKLLSNQTPKWNAVHGTHRDPCHHPAEDEHADQKVLEV